jgi:hypothetical protein
MTALFQHIGEDWSAVEKISKRGMNAVVLTALPQSETVFGIAKKVVPQ